MLHAAAMLIGLFLIAFAATLGTHSGADAAMLAGGAAMCVATAYRFGGLGGQFARAPRELALQVRRVSRVLGGAANTSRMAAAADVTLKPALIRVKTRAADAAQAADTISAAPGASVIELDSAGLLVHVLDEDGVEATRLTRLAKTGAKEAPW